MRRGAGGSWIDVTSALGPATRIYPGDPPVRIELLADPRRGYPARVSALSLCAHAGTHVDAPNHLPGGRGGVETLPLGAMIGAAVVIDAPSRRIGPRDLDGLPRGARRLLFRGAPAILPEAARVLIHRGVRLVGTDGLSVDPVGDRGLPAHRLLLAAGVVLLEGLDLARASPGRYHLIVLPLLIPGADGAPARAVLRRRAARPQLRK